MWYDTDISDNGIVISNRIRLARNLKNYPFSAKINKDQSSQMIKEILNSVFKSNQLEELFTYINLNELTPLKKKLMSEKHIISIDLSNKTQPTAVFVNSDKTISIMINEEDHIRIQTILAGNNIDKAWEMTDKIDNLIESHVNYAFDNEYGYLTSCPTNVGTGMRASYMLHIPLIELTSQIKYITKYLAQFGMTVRGIYGEGSETQGGIHQISNQITLGQTEEDIISNLKAVTAKVIEQEKKLREQLISKNYKVLEDQIYRAYGIVTNAKLMSIFEAMKDLSYIRLGYDTKILKEPLPKSNIYSIMVNMQSANLLKNCSDESTELDLNIARAEFIKKQFI